MSRKARVRSSLNLYHIVIRGINKQDIFIDNQDKQKFIKELSITKEKLGFYLYAYVIMPNHVHLVIKEKNTEISKIMHRIQLAYSEYLNIKYQRVGHVFQGRFSSRNIEDNEYLKCVIRYIHLNPDKAGIETYKNYRWSSYNEYMQFYNSKIVDAKEILSIFDTDINKAQFKFIKFHQEKSKFRYTEEDTEFEIVNKLDDEVIIKIITDRKGFNNIYDIQKLNNKYRDEILEDLLKIRGTTVPQISRITGVSKNIIEKVKIKMKK